MFFVFLGMVVFVGIIFALIVNSMSRSGPRSGSQHGSGVFPHAVASPFSSTPDPYSPGTDDSIMHAHREARRHDSASEPSQNNDDCSSNKSNGGSWESSGDCGSNDSSSSSYSGDSSSSSSSDSSSSSSSDSSSCGG